MAPGIALEALGKSKKSLRVLDPMAGSGTVLAVARSKGHKALGVDLDPLAVLLAEVWTRTVDPHEVTKKALVVLARAKLVFRGLSSKDAYPQKCDEDTRHFIRYWFDDYSRRQLASLAQSIGRVRNKSTRDVLWCGFSRLIITKQAGASLAMDLSHSRPHKKFSRAPVKPFNRFIDAVATVVMNCPQAGAANGPATIVKMGDARKLRFHSESIDLVLTSPPYLNAIDYLRCSKFSLVWMGYGVKEIRTIRGESVGTEASSEAAVSATWIKELIENLKLRPQLSKRHQSLISQYVWDMGRALSEASRVLKVNGRAVYVVGDSTMRGTFIRNSEIVSAVARRHGLTLKSRHSRHLPPNRRYLPPPKEKSSNATMDGRMSREVVLVFEKDRSSDVLKPTGTHEKQNY